MTPERGAEHLTVLRRVFQGEVLEQYETVRVHKDGTPVNVSLTVSPIRDPAGNIVDRKSTRLNSSHANISYAVFCLKKKKIKVTEIYTRGVKWYSCLQLRCDCETSSFNIVRAQI